MMNHNTGHRSHKEQGLRRRPMKIHGMCIVKNEVDIVDQSLREAATWCDQIYVYDNGSRDGTWERVIDLAGRYHQIVPYKSHGVPFTDSLRNEIFKAYQSNASDGDWWCHLDADEFYIDNPKEFLSSVPSSFDVVWAAFFNYYFTDEDLLCYQQDPSLYAESLPIEQRIRYYENNWSEPRFFRHKRGRFWNRNTAAWLGRSYPARIRLRHYSYRSPHQIEKRLETRRPAIRKGIWPQEKTRPSWAISTLRLDGQSVTPDGAASSQSWEDRIADSSRLVYDSGSGDYHCTEARMPKIPTSRIAVLRSLAGLVIQRSFASLHQSVSTGQIS
jgi:hypothetical protein